MIEKLKKNLMLQLGLLFVAAWIWFGAWLYIGHTGNCKPHDRDCEAGLSNMVGLLYGFGGAVAIFVGGGVTALFAYVRRNTKEQ